MLSMSCLLVCVFLFRVLVDCSIEWNALSRHLFRLSYTIFMSATLMLSFVTMTVKCKVKTVSPLIAITMLRQVRCNVLKLNSGRPVS